MSVYWQFAKTYTVLAARDRGIIVLTYVMPTMFFLLVSQTAGTTLGAVPVTLGMALIIGCISNGLQGAGQQAVSQRESDTLKRLQVTPISAMPILVASMASGLATYVPAVLLMHLASTALYGVPTTAHLLPALGIVVVGNIAFRSMGLIVGAVANSPSEATLITQFLYLPMLLLSGATIPYDQLPGWAQRIGALLPATYLVEALRSVLSGERGFGENSFCLAALLCTSAVSLALAFYMFRWTREDKMRPAGKLALGSVLLPFLLFAIY